jgi:hypothetical protein
MLALPGDSIEAVQPNELQGHCLCLSPERAILRRSADAPVPGGPAQAVSAAQVRGLVRLVRPGPGRRGQWNDHGNDHSGYL